MQDIEQKLITAAVAGAAAGVLGLLGVTGVLQRGGFPVLLIVPLTTSLAVFSTEMILEYVNTP